MKKVTVTVVAEAWGNYKKGDKIEMPVSTAKAVAAHKVIEYDGMPNDDDNDNEVEAGNVKAKDAIAAIKNMDSVEEIEAYTENEQRESVLKAATARIAELGE